jgi:hypothetical protein
MPSTRLEQLYQRIPQPKTSPWGQVQDADELAPGIWRVHTASHGGIFLTPQRHAELPANARETTYSKGGWFEEDCDALIPLYRFHVDIVRWLSATRTDYRETHTQAVILEHLRSHCRYLGQAVIDALIAAVEGDSAAPECIQCGASLDPPTNHPSALYCSDACALAWARRMPRPGTPAAEVPNGWRVIERDDHTPTQRGTEGRERFGTD